MVKTPPQAFCYPERGTRSSGIVGFRLDQRWLPDSRRMASNSAKRAPSCFKYTLAECNGSATLECNFLYGHSLMPPSLVTLAVQAQLHPLHRAFKRLAHWTWDRREEAKQVHFPFSEETITETIFYISP